MSKFVAWIILILFCLFQMAMCSVIKEDFEQMTDDENGYWDSHIRNK